MFSSIDNKLCHSSNEIICFAEWNADWRIDRPEELEGMRIGMYKCRILFKIVAFDNNLGEWTSTENSRDIYTLVSNGEGNSLIYS